MTKQSKVLTNLKQFRRDSGMNQTAFWGMFGITQSGGSRYESRGEVPEPLAVLLVLCEQGHIDQKKLEGALRVVRGE